MELRKHPRMTCLGESNWPPEWKGPYGPDNPVPRGEVGILIRVEPAARVLGTPHCFVVMQWNQQEYFRSLYCDEENFLPRNRRASPKLCRPADCGNRQRRYSLMLAQMCLVYVG